MASHTLESLGIAPGYSERYYECHITIDPVFDDELIALGCIAVDCGFKVAKLLMQKRSNDTAERSRYDTFMTARDRDFSSLKGRVLKCVDLLNADLRFTVRRVKIEDTLFDTNCGDKVRHV